jgi:hypothetical protein
MGNGNIGCSWGSLRLIEQSLGVGAVGGMGWERCCTAFEGMPLLYQQEVSQKWRLLGRNRVKLNQEGADIGNDWNAMPAAPWLCLRRNAAILAAFSSTREGT